MFGTAVTGEAFIGNKEREAIRKKYAPLSVDMESAGIAHVCYVNEIPFLSVRTVTDTPEQEGIEVFEKNCERASAISAGITVGILKTFVKKAGGQHGNLERGTMYVLKDGGTVAECVVTDETGGVLEIKNIAVAPAFERKGYGRALIRFLEETYRGKYGILQVGTGDSPLTVPFYESCGFVRSHCIRNFFTDHYNHPIWEGGELLRDMVYFRKKL